MTAPQTAIYLHPPRTIAARSARGGFTISELLVVLAILMILSVGAMAGYTRFQESRLLNTAGENLQAAMAAARSFAISTNAPYRLVLETRDPVTGTPRLSYWIDEIFPDTNTDPFPATPEAARTPKVAQPEFLPPGALAFDIAVRDTTSTAVAAPYAIIRFFRDGSTDGARIRLIEENAADPNTARRVVTVRLDEATGQSALRTELK